MSDDDDIPKKKRKQTCSICGPSYNTIFRIPKREPRRTEWIDFYKVGSSHPSSFNFDSIRLCYLHFDKTSINRSKCGKFMYLTPTSIPSISTPKEIERSKSQLSECDVAMSVRNSFKRITLKTDENQICAENISTQEDSEAVMNKLPPETACETREIDFNFVLRTPQVQQTGNELQIADVLSQNDPSTSTALASTPSTSHPGVYCRHSLRYIADIKMPDLDTPHRRSECIKLMRHENKVMKTKVQTLQKQNLRLKRKVRNLEDILKKFRKERLLSDDKIGELLENLPVPLREMVLGKLNSKKTLYAAKLRKFALTLHFYSPRAYAYVRKVLCNVLPSTSTLRKWYCASNFEPGFSIEVLESLKRKKEPKYS